MPPVLVSLVVLGLYLAAVLRLRLVQRRWPWWRSGCALLGAGVVAVAVSPLLHAAGPAGVEQHHTVPGRAAPGHGVLVDAAVGHMVQHLLLGMYAPLPVVLAAPVTLALAVAPLGWRATLRTLLSSRAVAVLTHPVVAAVPALVGMHVLFLTQLYRLSLEQVWVHHLVQLHLLLSGCLLAWSLVGNDPSPPRTGLLLRLGVLVVSAGTHAHLATLLYARAPQLPPGTPHDVAETQQAALWMYYGGDVAEVLLAVLVCLAWYRVRGARRRRGPDPGTTNDEVVTRPAAHAGRRPRPSSCLGALTADGVGARRDCAAAGPGPIVER